ncbi:MAG TPA: hypothetical protein VG406_10565 [Isosphaeraceae bacterium]|jgi:subtilase family serine protease|nr:hypothetical protein [Isosphaeraceae bacterium]
MIRQRGYRPRFDRLDGRWLPSVATFAGLTPAQLSQAYGFNSTANANGAGQTIAVVVAYHDPNLASDLATFDQANNLPGQSTAQVSGILSQVDQAGTQTNDGWAGEAALDVEWAHAAAPAAHIVVVEAKSTSLGDLLNAVDTAKNIPGVSVVSMSWGTSEFAGQTALDSTFTTPSGHTPITFVAASGDAGAFGGSSWPASSPNVVAVGGTSLTIGAGGTIASESGWLGSGGGVSSFEAAPSYQSGVQSTGARTTPDVSIVGDPSTGLSTYITSPSTGQGSWYVVGGTSASAQVWAGILADADSARAAAGLGTLSTSTALTDLYSSPSAFHSITTGFNGYSATPGYNLVAGLGSPDFAAVIHALDPTAPATPSTTTPTTPSTPTTTTPTTPTTTTTHSPSSGGSTTVTGPQSSPSTTTPAIALTPLVPAGAIVVNTPVAPAPPTTQVLGNTAATTGATSSTSTTTGGTATASAPSTPGVVAQGPLGDPGLPAIVAGDTRPPADEATAEPPAMERAPGVEDPAPADAPAMPAEEAPPANPDDEPKARRRPKDEATAPDRPQAWLDGLFLPQGSATADPADSRTLRSAPVPGHGATEADRGEDPAPSLSFGLAFASMAALRWDIRRRSRGQTPGDPLPLVRTSA